MARIEVNNKEGSKEAAFVQKLIDRYKEEIQKQLREIYKTAISIGMTEEELMNGIREWRKI